MHSANISVALTSFNGEKYIAEQLYSILNQSLPPSEIIICDDSSTDNTIKIIEEIAKVYTTIKLFKSKKQIGVIQNFSKAIQLCSENYIALSDQDDIWELNKLEHQLFVIQNHELKSNKLNAVLVVHDLKTFEKTEEFLLNSLWDKLGFNHLNPNKNISFTNKYYGCTMFFNRSLCDLINPIPNNVAMHDHWIALNASDLGSIIIIQKPLINYRRHQNNITSIPDSVYFYLRIKNYLKSFLAKNYKQKEILQLKEFLIRSNGYLPKNKIKEYNQIVKLLSHINLVRRIFFSIKFRF
jgi:glycosyltransferase involved in cell wall biosynthesis